MEAIAASPTIRFHMLPVGDNKMHVVSEQCWCFPLEMQRGLWAHNAKDCREARERITGKRCSEGWLTLAELYQPH